MGSSFMQEYGLVSIITPTWKCARFIDETIRSVLAQTYTNWELLIQDDCSMDGTEELVKNWAKKDIRIKYECNSCNVGAALTRNRALCRASGTWVAFLDSDDLWFPEKLEHQLRFMVKNDYAFSYHAYTEISESGEELGKYVSGISKVSCWKMYACCWPGCLTVMYNADRIGLIQIKDIPKNNDTALWLKVVRKSPCYFLDECLAHYRRRRQSITPKPLWKRIGAHYPLFHDAEGMNPLIASIWVFINVFGNAFKKIFYVYNDK
jgi:glycosyltransferase involved in cell wall biosynthesis